MKRLVLFIVVSLLLAQGASLAQTQKASLFATGYNWLGFSRKDKNSFAELVYVTTDINKKKHGPEEIVKTLDDFYYTGFKRAKADPMHVDENAFLKVPCVVVLKERFK